MITFYVVVWLIMLSSLSGGVAAWAMFKDMQDISFKQDTSDMIVSLVLAGAFGLLGFVFPPTVLIVYLVTGGFRVALKK